MALKGAIALPPEMIFAKPKGRPSQAARAKAPGIKDRPKHRYLSHIRDIFPHCSKEVLSELLHEQKEPPVWEVFEILDIDCTGLGK